MVRREAAQQAFDAYLYFIDRVPIGKTCLGWNAEHDCWEFKWQGRIAGQWYHLQEAIPEYAFCSGATGPNQLGERLAYRWQYAIKEMTQQANKEPV